MSVPSGITPTSSTDETVQTAVRQIDALLSSVENISTKEQGYDVEKAPSSWPKLQRVFGQLFHNSSSYFEKVASDLHNPIEKLIEKLPHIVLKTSESDTKEIYTQVFQALHKVKKWACQDKHIHLPNCQLLVNSIARIQSQMPTTFQLLRTNNAQNELNCYGSFFDKPLKESSFKATFESDCIKAKILSSLKQSGFYFSSDLVQQIQSQSITQRLISSSYINDPLIVTDWTGTKVNILIREKNVGPTKALKFPAVRIEPSTYHLPHPAPLVGWFIPDIRLPSVKNSPLKKEIKRLSKQDNQAILHHLNSENAFVAKNQHMYAKNFISNIKDLYSLSLYLQTDTLSNYQDYLSNQDSPLSFNTRINHYIQTQLFNNFWIKVLKKFYPLINSSYKMPTSQIYDEIRSLLDHHIQDIEAHLTNVVDPKLTDYVFMMIRIEKPLTKALAFQNLLSLFSQSEVLSPIIWALNSYLDEQQESMKSALNDLRSSPRTIKPISFFKPSKQLVFTT